MIYDFDIGTLILREERVPGRARRNGAKCGCFVTLGIKIVKLEIVVLDRSLIGLCPDLEANGK